MAITRVQDGAPEADLDTKAAYGPMQPSAPLNNWNAMVSHHQVTHAQVLLYCTNYLSKLNRKTQNETCPSSHLTRSLPLKKEY